MAGDGCCAGWVLLCVLAFAALGGCRYPRDPLGTLDRVEGGVLRVGVTENAPMVIRDAHGAGGVEPAIVRALAEQLGADIEWHWGTESELIKALELYQLDIALGGFTETAPVQRIVAFSKPYFIARVTVGVPGGRPMPAALDGLAVTIANLSGLTETLESRAAKPVHRESVATATGPVAAPVWWLQAHGFTPGPWTLREERHIMLAPPGENAWLLRLQEHFAERGDIAGQLAAAERSIPRS